MPIRLPILAAALFGALAAPAAADASSPDTSGTAAAPGEVVVGYDTSTSAAQKQAVAATTGTTPADSLPDGAQVLKLKYGASVSRTLGELKRKSGVRYAVPNFRMHAAGAPSPFFPNDPGKGTVG